jgi:hypothetical protein
VNEVEEKLKVEKTDEFQKKQTKIITLLLKKKMNGVYYLKE